MRICLEIEGDLHNFVASINGVRITSDVTEPPSRGDKELERLWADILHKKVFNSPDEANGVELSDTEYPASRFPLSVADLVLTQQQQRQDGYYARS